jgi:EmrB/QacA subfamily drug resistance transporter
MNNQATRHPHPGNPKETSCIKGEGANTGPYIIHERPRQLWLIGLIALGGFIVNLDMTIVNISLPVISREFSISPGTVSWIVLSYLLCETAFMLPIGELANRKGIRNIFLWGFALFTIGSLFCGLSPGFSWLVASRALQGIGGAMVFTVMLTFITLHLPQEKRVGAVGVATTAAALGVGLGPPLGGVLTTYAGWRWIFFVNLPICMPALWLIWKHLPDRSPISRIPRFDYAGTFLFSSALLSFLFAVNTGREYGWASLTILSCFGYAAAAAYLFFLLENRIEHPVLDLRLFRNPEIRFPLLAMSLSFMTVGGVLFIFPFYLLDFRLLSPHESGLFMIPLAAGQFIGPWSGKLTAKFGVLPVCIAALAMGCASFILFLFLDAATTAAFILASLGLFGLSLGIGKAPNFAHIMELAPDDSKALVSSIVTLLRSLSIAIGVLLFETVFSDSIPHAISLQDTHIADIISHHTELYPGFFNAFAAGLGVSLLASGFMASGNRKAAR